MRKIRFIFRESIIKYRNPFIHDPIIGNINGKIPNKDKVIDYKKWSQIEAIKDNVRILENDFLDISKALENDMKKTLNILNKIWDLIIKNISF